MDQTALLTELNRNVNDANNFTFTTDQKADALARATNDTYAVTEVWDESITFTIGTWQYAVPADMTLVTDIYLQRDTTQFPEAISRELWEQVAGNIQFNNSAHWSIPSNYQLFLKGFYKVTTADTITDTRLQQYILSLAGWNLLKTMTYTKLGSFLRNDTQVAELLSARKEMFNDVLLWRQQLQGFGFVAA